MSGDYGHAHSSYGDGSDVFSLTDNRSVVLRFVVGTHPVNRVWLPILYPDSDTGELAESWKPFTVNRTDSIFRMLAIQDRKNQQNHGIDKTKARSAFDAQGMNAYLGFVREDEELVLRVIEVKYSVMKRLIELGREKDPGDHAKLLNGPWCFWDAVQTRKMNTDTGFPNYSVEPYRNKFEGKIPIKYSDDKKAGGKGIPPGFDMVEYKVLTEQEVEAIDAFKETNNLERLSDFFDSYEPEQSNDSVLAFLTDNAVLDLNRVRGNDGKPVFQYPKELVKLVEEKGIEYMLGATEAKKLKPKKTGKQEEETNNGQEEESGGSLTEGFEEKEDDKKGEVEDADFEEIPGDSEQEEASKEEEPAW